MLAESNEQLNYPKKIVDGKMYYEYTVQKSEGFYSICKKFNVSEEEIKAVNPGTQNGLSYASVILIPYKEKKHTLHKVGRRETLYSISKKYEITVEDIYNMNPNIQTEGLRSGMMIKIPEKTLNTTQLLVVNDSLPKIEKTEQPSFSVHVVKKGETLYSISRHYGISTEEIIRLNPDVKDGMKTDQKLIIPPVQTNSVEGEPQYRTHHVQKKETIYSISKMYNVTHEELVRLNPDLNNGLKADMLLVIPSLDNQLATDSLAMDSTRMLISLDSIADVKDLFIRSYEPKKEMNIAITLPFQLNKITPNNKIDGNTKRFLEFYQGFLLAVDSLKKTGLSFNIYTFDSGKTEEEIQKILDLPEMKEMDLLIGPAYTSQIKKMADFSLENNIKMVIPFSTNSDQTLVNPNIFQINPPVDKNNFMMAELFIKQFSDKNIVLWRFKNSSYDDKKGFADTLSAMLTEKNIPFKTVFFDNIATIRAALVNDKENIVIPLTSNQLALNQALPMINMLHTDKRKISLFGFSEWQNYQSLSKDLFVLNTYMTTCFHTDFSNPEVRKYLTKFRHFYNAEPFNSQIQYGMVGYDIAFYFASAIAALGHDFEFSDKKIEVNTLQSKFYFTRMAEKGGFYSTGIFLTNHNDQTGQTAVNGMTMEMCPICKSNMEKLMLKNKKK
jgi:LysM repeat protein/ABC-type branched-subunit amino acid transport system substrate-binding protein